jgi:hypothetical protein
LQAVLDRALKGIPVNLIVDGAALISGLNVYGNTTITCINGGGFFLQKGSNRALIRNVHRSRDAVQDSRITLAGCFLNGNRRGQSPALVPLSSSDISNLDQRVIDARNKESDGTYMSALQFMGVNDLALEHLTIWNARAFGALISNGERITIRDVTVDDGSGADADILEFANTDGLHFKGPLRYVTIDGVRAHVGDDAIALNADDYDTDDLTIGNEFGPYVRSGPITDVTVNNLQLMDTRSGIRLLSSTHRLDRIAISNVSGSVRGWHVAVISHWLNTRSLGNVGTVALSNVTVDWPIDPKIDVSSPYIKINARIEAVILRNVVMKVGDGRPILRLAPDANVDLLSADLHLLDPGQQASPIILDSGCRVDVMTLSLDWQGAAPVNKRNPITDFGASVRELRWIDTHLNR